MKYLHNTTFICPPESRNQIARAIIAALIPAVAQNHASPELLCLMEAPDTEDFSEHSATLIMQTPFDDYRTMKEWDEKILTPKLHRFMEEIQNMHELYAMRTILECLCKADNA